MNQFEVTTVRWIFSVRANYYEQSEHGTFHFYRIQVHGPPKLLASFPLDTVYSIRLKES